MFSEILDEEITPLAPDEELDAELNKEKAQRLDADKRTVEENHKLARRALRRIKVIRASRVA